MMAVEIPPFMSVRIPLSGGMYATVDETDLPLVSGASWHWVWGRNTAYAQRTVWSYEGNSRRSSTVRMHRLIINAPPGVMVDHIDGNGLNNCRANLRLCNQSENSMNRRVVRAISGYKGVYLSESGARYGARIFHAGKDIHLGYFPTADSAARAYDAAAIRYFGAFAAVNFSHSTRVAPRAEQCS